MRSKKKLFRNIWLRKLLKIHSALTILFLGAYLVLAFLDPGLLSYDLRQKYQALADEAITVAATVLGPPAKPIVSATAQCDSNTGTLSVALDWADDTNTSTYDVDRDSLPLITGLVTSGYTDLNVAVGTTYEYEVTAYGPMGPGFATSDPVLVTTPTECVITVADPTVNIISFGGKAVAGYDEVPRVHNRRPIFSGTTNMASATMQVVVGPTDSLIATFPANANGYWEWKPPVGLSSGTQVFTVTAIDPNNVTRQASASLTFRIKQKDDEKEDANTMNKATPPSRGVIEQPQQPSPIDFSLSIEKQDKTVWRGEPLHLLFFTKYLTKQYDNTNIPLRFSIINEEGNVVVSFTDEELLHRERQIRKQLNIPSYVVAGKYGVQVEFLFDHVNVSQVEHFLLLESPLIQLGGGLVVTYPEVIRYLGWVTLTLLVLLLLWLLLFMREYGMYLQAARHITERHLRKAGFLTKRKGAIG